MVNKFRNKAYWNSVWMVAIIQVALGEPDFDVRNVSKNLLLLVFEFFLAWLQPMADRMFAVMIFSNLFLLLVKAKYFNLID